MAMAKNNPDATLKLAKQYETEKANSRKWVEAIDINTKWIIGLPH
jgi:hypothetical protein